MNTIDVKAATTAELVAFYNAHSEKPVKKFADRKTAERRVQQLLDSAIPFEEEPKLPADEREEAEDARLMTLYGRTRCPHCEIHLTNGVSEHHQDVNGKPLEHGSMQFACLACDGEFGPAIKSKRKEPRSEARAAGVAASWDDPEVREKRKQRHHVRIDGKQEFRSVRAAFVALGLPLNEHIKFRIRLKEEEQMNAYGYDWEVIEA